MSLKRQYQLQATFSMASMTDVIFLLLIFFMVTSTYVLPNAIDVDLPESSQEEPLLPSARIYVDADMRIFATFAAEEPREMEPDTLLAFLQLLREQEPDSYVALYADEAVTYGRIVEVLDMGGRAGVKMVLATVPAPQSVMPTPPDPPQP